MRKIDCHTHIVNRRIRDAYFSKTDGYAIVLEMLPCFGTDELANESRELVAEDDRLFLCPAIDLKQPIPPQLTALEKRLQREKIIGLKIFLSYQSGRADDEKMMCIYDFARAHRLTVTFHTGLCSLVLPSDNDVDGSDARYIANVAERYPDVNFVAAHMDDPRFMQCLQLMHSHPNLYSDFSGAYEAGTYLGDDMQGAIRLFAEAIHQYADSWKQMLYGTDFCPPINLVAMQEYEQTVEAIFAPEVRDAVYYDNCLRAFPRLNDCIR